MKANTTKRKLTVKQRQRAAESLSLAQNELVAARTLKAQGQFASGFVHLYYASFHTGKAALSDTTVQSKKHAPWNGELNKRFGRGQGWLPKTYARLPQDLQTIREDAQYEGVVANDPQVFDKYERVVVKFIAFVMNRTPLCHYEEFILDLVHKQSIGPSVEFDYYCPKSYVHKDRCQYQVMRQRFNTRTIALLNRAGRETIERLHGSRIEDYVLGWNNRLGQSAEAFLLFLDIDHSDEGDVKAALKGQQGWLFKTGAGYHFIGKKPIESDEEWRVTMKKLHRSKGLKKLLDQRYLEYSLRRGFSTVRITRSPVKTFRPFLCAEIK